MQHPKIGGAPGNTKPGDGNRDRGRDRPKKDPKADRPRRDDSKPPKPKGDGKGGKGKGKGKGDKGKPPAPKAKADPKKKGTPPKSEERPNSRPPMSDEKKATITCRYWKQGNCGDAECKYAHNDNPKKVPAGAAVIVPGMIARPKSPKLTTYVVELMGDSGAGRHLGSIQAFANQGIPEEAIKAVLRDTKFPVQFETGGGDQDGKKTITLKCPDMHHSSLMYMLENCPLALSIGQIVNESKLPCVWIPGQVPFFAKPESLKWNCHPKNRINASRVRQNVPMFDLSITVASGMPATVSKESEPAVAEAQEPEASPVQSEVPVSDESPIVEIALNSAEYANSVEHLSTHFPKNTHCKWCQRANLQAAPARRSPAPTSDVEPLQTMPMSHIYGDHMIMGQRSEGSQKERACLLLIDSHTGLERAYPAPTRDQKHAREALQHFHCTRHANTKTLFRSDCAKELTGAARDLGFVTDPSLPQRRVHNARCENRINTVKRGARAALLQSGLPHNMWPECVQYITDARSFILPSMCDDSQSRYKAATGEDFAGKIVPFGSLVYYRPYNANKSQSPLEAWSKPGIMLGYQMRPGLKWGKGYRILDYARLQSRQSNAFSVIIVPEISIPVGSDQKPAFIFPIAAAREKATSEFKPLEFDQLELDKLDDMIAALDDEDDIPLLDLQDGFLDERKKSRAVKVTVERILRLGPTPNCGGCNLGQARHNNECHERFAKLIKDEDDHKQVIKEIKNKHQSQGTSSSSSAFACGFVS